MLNQSNTLEQPNLNIEEVTYLYQRQLNIYEKETIQFQFVIGILNNEYSFKIILGFYHI